MVSLGPILRRTRKTSKLLTQSQRGIEAGATLLDERKVKAGRAGNGLKVVGNGAVRVQCGFGIRLGNSRVLPFGEIGHGVLEFAPEVRILQRTAIPRPPTGVDGQLSEVREPPILRHSCHSAGRENRKRT